MCSRLSPWPELCPHSWAGAGLASLLWLLGAEICHHKLMLPRKKKKDIKLEEKEKGESVESTWFKLCVCDRYAEGDSHYIL